MDGCVSFQLAGRSCRILSVILWGVCKTLFTNDEDSCEDFFRITFRILIGFFSGNVASVVK